MSQLKQTPSQTVGPFFAYGLCPEQYNFDLKSLFTANAAEPGVAGEHIIITGTVYDGSGAAVGDAIVESLQADASGNTLPATMTRSLADSKASAVSEQARRRAIGS